MEALRKLRSRRRQNRNLCDVDRYLTLFQTLHPSLLIRLLRGFCYVAWIIYCLVIASQGYSKVWVPWQLSNVTTQPRVQLSNWLSQAGACPNCHLLTPLHKIISTSISSSARPVWSQIRIHPSTACFAVLAQAAPRPPQTRSAKSV